MAEHPLVSARRRHPRGRELFLLRRVDLRISEIGSPIASTIAAATCSRLNHLLSAGLPFRRPLAAAGQEVRRLALVQPQAASVSRVEILLAGSPALGDAVRSDVRLGIVISTRYQRCAV